MPQSVPSSLSAPIQQSDTSVDRHNLELDTSLDRYNLNHSKFVVVVGRIDRWLRHPEQGTLNVSCTVRVCDPVYLWEDMVYTSTALRGAAGINLIVNNFSPATPRPAKWKFDLSPIHADFKDIDLGSGRWGRFAPSLDSQPVVIRVADSMTVDEPNAVSIERSWQIFYLALASNQKVVVDLSRLRPNGHTNKHGLVASGPLSFLKIYEAIANYVRSGTLVSYLQIFSCLNEVLRRGGHYKNGAVVATLDATHENALEFINFPLSETPHLKKALRVYPEILRDISTVDAILAQINAGSLWLEKDLGTHDGEQLWSNVCKGVSLKDGGSCLLGHVNAGQIEKPEDFVQAWRDVMSFICAVFEVGAIREAGIYRDPETDRQVAVGILGLANCLAYHGVKYREFVEAFEGFLDGRPLLRRTIADELVWYNACGVKDAADIARSHNMRAAFTVEPTASCAYRSQDLRGFTCAPNIDPIIAIPGTGVVRRNSEAVGDRFYNHGPEVETVEEVGADIIRRLRECWQRLFDSTGLSHMSSYEIYKNWTVDDLKQWFNGPLKTTYYRRPSKVEHLAKGRKITTAKQFEASCNVNDMYCESCGD